MVWELAHIELVELANQKFGNKKPVLQHILFAEPEIEHAVHGSLMLEHCEIAEQKILL